MDFLEDLKEQNETDPSELLILAYSIDLLQQTAPEQVDPVMLKRFQMLSLTGAINEMSEAEKREFMKYCKSIEERAKKPYVESSDSYLRLRVQQFWEKKN